MVASMTTPPFARPRRAAPVARLAVSLTLGLSFAISTGLLGCGSSSTAKLPFEAAISASPETGNAPFSVHFVVRHNGGLEGTDAYAWDFGDGGSADTKEADHVFERAGSFHVVVTVADSKLGDATAETTVEIAEPVDFTVSDVSADPRTVQPGADVHISGGLVNTGAAPVGPWQLAYVLSTDNAFSSEDIRLKVIDRSGSPEAPLESLDETIALPADLPSGDYFVGVVADPDATIGDANRDNNASFSLFPLEVRNTSDTGPDLVICGLDVPAFGVLGSQQVPVVQQGDQMEIHVCMANAGNRPTPDGAVQLFLSTDDRYDAADISLWVRDGVALGVGDRFEDTVVVDLPIDLEIGNWFLLLVADPTGVVEEQLEDNNTRATPNPFNLVAPGNVDGVDLVVTDFSATADKVFWGQSFPVTLRLSNRGHTDVARNFVVRVEAEPSDGREAVTLVSLNVNGLAAGAEANLDTDVVVTQRVPAGAYCLRAVADPTGSTMDENPGNNGRRASCLDLGGEPDIDLSVRNVSFSPETVAAGEPLHVQGTLQNVGADASGPSEMAVVFSLDTTFDADDPVVDRFDVEPVVPGTDVVLDRMVVVPATLDQNVALWHVAVVADPNSRIAHERTRENNVAFAPTAVGVTGTMGGCAEDADHEDNDDADHASQLPAGEYPNLGLCDGADWFQVDVPAGSALDVMVRVSDISFADTATVPFLNLETQAGTLVSRGDIFGQAVGAFAEPAPVDRTLRFSLMADAPLVYSLTIGLIPGGDAANLRPRYVAAAPTEAGPGGFVSVTFEAVNVGGADAEATLAGVYLVAPGGAVDAAARLGRVDVPALPAGTSQAVDTVVTVPADATDGAHELVVRLDDTSVVAEGAEDDNEARIGLSVAAAAVCASDAFEPNRAPADDGTGAVAAVVTQGTYENLVVCGNDTDWYAIDLAPGEGLRVDVNFVHADGDIDIVLYEPDGETSVTDSRGTGNTETVEFFGTPAGGRYYLKVILYGADGAANPSNTYTLDVTVNAAGGCVPDAFEPNGTSDTAAVVADGEYVLTLCPGNEDWFRFSLVAGNTVTFRAQSDSAVALTLYGPDDAVLDQDDLAVVWDALADGVYRLKVTSDSAIPVSYSLRVRGASGIDLEALDLSVAPESTAPGDEIRVTGRVRNDLGDTLQDVGARILLSDDDVPSPDDVTLGDLVLPRVGNVDAAAIRTRVRIPNDAAPGDHFVILVADADRRVADARRANNSIAVPLRVRGLCVDDDQRTNEGPATATVLDVAAGTYDSGVICAYTEDWFRLDLPADSGLTVNLAFDAAAGDLDLFVYDAVTGARLGDSATDGALETVTLPSTGPVLVRVDGFLDAENAYTVSWTVP